jgi:hypothetical protein
MGSGFDKAIYLDVHLAELQLFGTPHKVETLSSLSCILAPGSFLVIPSPAVFCLSAVSVFFTGLTRRRILTSPVGKSFFNGLQSQSQSQSYIANDGRSISKSWCRAPSGAHDQIFIIV